MIEFCVGLVVSIHVPKIPAINLMSKMLLELLEKMKLYK